MNIDVLSGNGVNWWTAIIRGVIAYVIVAIGAIDLNFERKIKTGRKTIEKDTS